jgi:hypothetical protein
MERIRSRLDTPSGDRLWIVVLGNALAPATAPMMPGGRATIVWLLIVLLISLAAAFTIRVDRRSVARKWSGRTHVVPRDLREFTRLRWRVLFELLLIAECMAPIGILAGLDGPVLALVTWLPALMESVGRYAAWRIARADYRNQGIEW